MDWQQLLGFYQVAKLGSFTKAAEATLRTQPALSQQVKALEEELDCQLLERLGKRRLRLTLFGEKLLDFAEALFKNFETFKEELNQIKGLNKGRLRLAAPFTTIYHLLRDPLNTYIRAFPQVELTILDRPQSAVLALLKNGDIDFGFTRASLAPPELATLKWKPVETVLMTPLGHPLTGLKRVTLKQMAKYPLILPPKNHPARKKLEDYFRKNRIDYHIILESSNVELSSVYVEMGLGLSISTMARDLPTVGPRKLAFIPLSHYFKTDFVAIVMRKDQVLTPFKTAFIDILLGEPRN